MHFEFQTNGTHREFSRTKNIKIKLLKIKGENYLIRPIYLYCRRIWTKQLSIYLLCKRTRNLPILSLFFISFFFFPKIRKNNRDEITVRCTIIWHRTFNTPKTIELREEIPTMLVYDWFIHSFIFTTPFFFTIIVS